MFENLLTQIMVRMEDAGCVKKRMFHYFLGVARRCGEQILNGKPVGVQGSPALRAGRPARLCAAAEPHGLLAASRVAYTAGEAIGPELFRFYRSLGINLKQLYGQTEASVYITLQPDGEVYPDTVGKPGPDVEIKIADSGEVLFKSPGVFLKYYKNDEATSATKTPDGWVHTGDAGFFDQRGHLKIIDRAKDVGRLNSGALFAPKYLENRIKFYPEMREAVAFGQGRDYVTMLINIDLTSVGNWAERNNVVLCQLPGAGRASAGLRDGRQARRRAEQGAGRRAADGGLPDPALPDPAQGARCRRRRADPHAEGAPLVHRRSLRRR